MAQVEPAQDRDPNYEYSNFQLSRDFIQELKAELGKLADH